MYPSSSCSVQRRYSSSSTDSRHTRSGSDSATDDYDSDIDLQKELKPLSAYLRSPKDLVDQMLHSVRGSSLQRALPDVLKVRLGEVVVVVFVRVVEVGEGRGGGGGGGSFVDFVAVDVEEWMWRSGCEVRCFVQCTVDFRRQ